MREHIVIFSKTYIRGLSLFQMILDGTKTIGIRWSMNRCAPYGKVAAGDALYLKETGKPVTARAVAKDVRFYELTPTIVEEIREQYGGQIGTDDPASWSDKRGKRYCTLVWLDKVEEIPPIEIPPSHGAGWIIWKEEA